MFNRPASYALSRRSFLKCTGGAAVSVVLLTACAPAVTTTESQGQATDAGSASAVQEPVTLRFSTIGWGGWLSEPWMEMLNRFNEANTGVQASFEDIAEGYEKVMAQAAGNVAADVYLFENKFMYSYASRGFFLPLDDMVAGSQVVTKDAYYEEDWNETFWKGTQYLAPFDNSPAMIWYNTDLFDAAGVTDPPSAFDDPNWQWDDFLTTAQQLTQGEGANRIFGWVGERTWYYLLNWIWSNGGDVLNAEKTECVIDMPETVEALQWAADLALTHQVQPMADQIIEGGNSAMFFGQRAAMAQKGTWWAIDLKAQEGLNWNIAPQPAGAAGAYVRNPLDAYGIWSGTQQPEAAWQLIESLSTPDSLAIIVRAGLSVSRKETMEEVFLTQEPQHVHWQLFLDALESHTRRHPDTAIYPEMHDLLQSNWESLLDGATSVEEMVASVKEPINQLLAECLEEGNCVAETA